MKITLKDVENELHHIKKRLWILEHPPEFKYGDKAYAILPGELLSKSKKVKVLNCNLQSKRNSLATNEYIHEYCIYYWLYDVDNGERIFETTVLFKKKP